MRLKLMKLFAIAIGGSIGALLRYAVSQFTSQSLAINSFPMGTLFVNVSGCFIGGIILGSFTSKFSQETRAFLVLGILGSYTTFSSFGMETIGLVDDGKIKSAALYIFSTFLLTLIGVMLGYVLSKKIFN